jgi:hypothetical protein
MITTIPSGHNIGEIMLFWLGSTSNSRLIPDVSLHIENISRHISTLEYTGYLIVLSE